MECFEKQNIKELTIEEAQEQFLTLMASYSYSFGSHYVVRRKPPQSLLLIQKGKVAGLTKGTAPVLGSRRDPLSLESIHRKMKEKDAKKKAAAKKGRPSKFDSSSSANESSSESSASEEEDEKSEDLSGSVLSDENEDGEKSDSDPSTISGLS